MKNNFLFVLIILILALSCEKDIVEYTPISEQHELVVDGTIETDLNPIIILSRSSDIYSPTDLESFLQNFIYNAEVKVVNQSDTFDLELKPIADLDVAHQKKLAEMLGLKELKKVFQLPLMVYTSNNITGKVEQYYELIIDYNANRYWGTTYIPQNTALDLLYWNIEPGSIEYGYSWAKLSDPANQYDAYKWEAKRTNVKADGTLKDDVFMKTKDAYFDDEFFDGLSFDFSYERPGPRRDSTHLKDYKRFYRIGDTVVVKFSKLDQNVYDFFRCKAQQISNAGNPFATPINIPSNMSNGAIGVWAGYSPIYDTLYCHP
tara:strand:- start:380 stop:1333 length:954 start_codon:yes stop_codon:yes gene_type:complete